MAADWLLEIDPDASHWEDNGRNNWTNTVTGKKYNSGDMVNHMLAKINAQNKAEGKGPYVPGITALPDELKTIPAGMPYEEYIKHAPAEDWDIVKNRQEQANNIGSGNAAQDYNDFFLGGVTPGFSWNGSGSSGGQMPGQMAGTAEGPTWQSGQMYGGGMERTGQREAFKPFGSIEGYSSEILRYGGPVSGSGGRWDGMKPGEMIEIGGTTHSPEKVDMPEFTGYQQQLPGGGYQNIRVDKRDGETWTDPATGQDYVWRDGRFQKADLKNRIGPTTEDYKVTNTGGTGTENDPFKLILGGNTDQQALLAQLLRNA